MQSQRHPVHQKSHIGCPGFEPGLCGENRVKNSLRQGTRTFALQPADVPTCKQNKEPPVLLKIFAMFSLVGMRAVYSSSRIETENGLYSPAAAVD